jgi:hypothetical protein
MNSDDKLRYMRAAMRLSQIEDGMSIQITWDSQASVKEKIAIQEFIQSFARHKSIGARFVPEDSGLRIFRDKSVEYPRRGCLPSPRYAAARALAPGERVKLLCTPREKQTIRCVLSQWGTANGVKLSCLSIADGLLVVRRTHDGELPDVGDHAGRSNQRFALDLQSLESNRYWIFIPVEFPRIPSVRSLVSAVAAERGWELMTKAVPGGVRVYRLDCPAEIPQTRGNDDLLQREREQQNPPDDEDEVY